MTSKRAQYTHQDGDLYIMSYPLQHNFVPRAITVIILETLFFANATCWVFVRNALRVCNVTHRVHSTQVKLQHCAQE